MHREGNVKHNLTKVYIGAFLQIRGRSFYQRTGHTHKNNVIALKLPGHGIDLLQE